MKNLTTIIGTAAVAAGFAFAPALGQPQCETTFDPVDENQNPVDSGLWNDPNNWDPDEPDADTVACIPPSKTARIENTQEEAEAVWVQRDANGDGIIDLHTDNNSGALTLHADSTVDGELRVNFGTLFIANDVTIDGTGGLALDYAGASIEQASGSFGPTLTLTGAGTGAWDDRTDSLFLYGSGNIKVELVNNAHVIANNLRNSQPLTVSKPSGGSGFWIAEDLPNKPAGILDVRSTISDAGTFVVADSSAEIRINAADTAAEADVLVVDGTFLVRENYETTGNLAVEKSASTVIVRQGKKAVFKKPAT